MDEELNRLCEKEGWDGAFLRLSTRRYLTFLPERQIVPDSLILFIHTAQKTLHWILRKRSRKLSRR
jgi:hypothetical protein